MDERGQKSVSVKESASCPLWERSELPGVAVLRECWFCKWSDFRSNLDEYKSVGSCFNPKRLISEKQIGVVFRMQPFELSFHGLNSENIEQYTEILTSTREFDLSSQLVLGCECNSKPCGLVAVEVSKKKYAKLIWIEVLGGLRRRGIGTQLLDTMSKCLKSMGVVQITAAYSAVSSVRGELESFLEKNEYSLPVLTQKVYFADFADVREGISEKERKLLPQMEGGIQSLAALPPKTERSLKTAVSENRIPAFVLPENAVGELLEDYSLAYTEVQSVCAAVMYSALPKVLYMDALYISCALKLVSPMSCFAVRQREFAVIFG